MFPIRFPLTELISLTLWVRFNCFESAPIFRHTERCEATEQFVRVTGLTIVFASLLIIFAPSSAAIESIGVPSYTTDDWFEYEGYTEQLVASLTNHWEAEDDFRGVEVTTREELRVTQQGNENCNILSWNGDCNKAKITHLVNFTVDWMENSTNYDNDTLNMSVSYSGTHWKSRGTAGWEKLEANTLTITQFSGGGENNFLEHEINEVILTRRVGDFPENVKIGESWDIEKTIEITGVERTRENLGVWDENEYNHSTTSQVLNQVIGERVIRYGVANEKSHDTLAVERIDLGSNITTIDCFIVDGFLAHTETWNNGTLELSATLSEFRYYVNEPHEITSYSNWLFPTVFVCLLLIVVLGVGATWFGLSSVPKTRIENEDDDEN